MTCTAVTLGSIVMNGTADSDGIVWTWRDLPGWWETGAGQGDQFGRLRAHGSSHGVGWYRGKAVTVIGTATAPKSAADPVALLKMARRKLMAAVDMNTAVDLSVDEGAIGTLRLPVRQAPLQPRFLPQRSVRELLFEVPVVSDDWRKTDDTVTQVSLGEGGVVTVGGTAPATPSLRIQGDSLPNVGVTNVTTGQTIATDIDLAPGDVLIIDVATATATLNGADATEGLALGSDFFDLIVGNNTVNVIASGSLRVDYRTSWK